MCSLIIQVVLCVFAIHPTFAWFDRSSHDGQSTNSEFGSEKNPSSKPIRIEFIGSVPNDKARITCQDGTRRILPQGDIRQARKEPFEICPGALLRDLEGAQRLTFGQSSVLFLNQLTEQKEAKLLSSLSRSELKSDILKLANAGTDQSSSSELLKAIAPTFAVVTAGSAATDRSDDLDYDALMRISDALSAKQAPLMQVQVLACKRDGAAMPCQWSRLMVHENLLMTNEGNVTFLLFPNGVQRVDDAIPQELAADCRSDTSKLGKQIKLSRFSRHTGILVPREELARLDLPSDLLNSDLPWLDISWGDEGLFLGTEEQDTVQNYIAAGWLHRPAAVRILASDGSEASAYMDVQLDQIGYQRLLEFIKASIQRDSNGAVIDRSSFAAPELHSNDTIFLAAGDVVPIPRSCNRWTAIALSHAGCESWPSITLTNSQLWEIMSRLKH